MKFPLSVFALTLSTFAIGTTEFVIMGLLQEVAESLSITIPQAGGLITGYAIGVVIGGPTIISLGIKSPRKVLLLLLMAIFIIGNAIAAISTSYEVLMLARVVTATCHGAFIGLASVVAADLVPSQKRAQAISLVFAGGAMANVLGAPVGTYIGQALGWRSTFIALSAIGIVSLLFIVTVIPNVKAKEKPSLLSELLVFTKATVAVSLAMTAFSLGALFAAFSYVAPLLTEVTSFSSKAIAPLLALFGLGLVVGNHFGGVFADRNTLRTLMYALMGLATALTLLSLVSMSQPATAIALFLVGVMGFATVPGLMTFAITKAGNAPTLAAVITVSASNIGIALGAYLGGAGIREGLGYTSPIWIGVLLALLGLAFTYIASCLEAAPKVTINPHV